MIPQFQSLVLTPAERPANDLWIWSSAFFTPSKGQDGKGTQPHPGSSLTNWFLILWAAEVRHCSHSGQNSLQSQRQHAGSNQCWLVFGEILGLSIPFDSVFPVGAIPSHADLGLEGGNSHSCLSDGAISSTGRQGPSWSSRGPKVLILALASRQEAGVHVAGLELHPIFS